jgi:uncharacterized protein YdbL (DUF1318 family)
MARIAFASLCLLASLAACTTHVVVEQPKPLEININFTGHLNLVIQDARQNLEQITGEKPTNVVRPEDIGLPAVSRPGARGAGLEEGKAVAQGPADAVLAEPTFPILSRGRPGLASGMPTQFIAQSEADLTKAMAARNAKIQQLWSQGLVGESHTGLLVAKGSLSQEQQGLVDAENADRSALYAAEATRKNVKADEVALGYYVARLGYAKAGAWYEVRNPSTSQWEWKKWGQ